MLSQIDGMGDVTAAAYDNLGDPVAASQGQVLNLSGGSATFDNLPQSPNQARTYTIYVKSSSTLTSTSGTTTLTDSDGYQTLNHHFSSTTPLGTTTSGWYELGTVNLLASDASPWLTVAYTAASATQVAVLEQTSSTVYDPMGLVQSQTDGLNNVTTYGYNGLEQQVSVSQGQIVPVNVNTETATVNNLPQTPGQARTYTVYVETTAFDGNLAVNDNLGSLVLTPPTGSAMPLTSAWSEAGTVTLAAGDPTPRWTLANWMRRRKYAWSSRSPAPPIPQPGWWPRRPMPMAALLLTGMMPWASRSRRPIRPRIRPRRRCSP